MTLVMTLLVRDEIDIIETNLDFHLAQGVAHVIVIDNGSVDGTRELLAEYARSHPVTVLDEPEQNYNQTLWMTRAALMAREELGASWVLNNDADEFWFSPEGLLSDHLGAAAPDILVCSRHNMVFAWDGPDSRTPAMARALYHVRTPLDVPLSGLPLEAPLPCPYFYRKLPPKVLTRTRGLTRILQGNHSAEFAHPPRQAKSDIRIYHYPVRGRDQLRSKVVNGGASYAANTAFSISVGWHWRRWYAMVQAQGIDAVMADALPSQAAVARDLDAGVLIRDTALLERLAALGLEPGA